MKHMPSFLVVEVPPMTTPMAAYTRDHPDVTLDFFVLTSPRQAAGAGPLQAIAQAMGPRRRELIGLLQVVRRAYPGTRVVQGPDAGGGWMASFDLAVAPLDPVARAIIQFTDKRGLRLRWGRLQQGVGYVRCLVERPGDVQGLAEDLRRELATQGLDADVAVETMAEERLSQWLDTMHRVWQIPSS